MKYQYSPEVVIRAIPSVNGGYNISPEGGISYPTSMVLSTPDGLFVTHVRRGDKSDQSDYEKAIAHYLSLGYTNIVNGRLSPDMITRLGVQTYIDKLLSQKNGK